MSLGTLIIIFANSMTLYFIGRSLEGLAAGAISPICRAIYSDRYHEKQELGRKLAIMAAVVSIMPAIGPLLAGFLVSDLGWRAPFIAFFIAGLLAIIIFTLAFKETKNRQDKPSIKTMLSHYKEVFANRRFCLLGITYSFLTGALISYYAATAFWFVFQYHIKESVFSYFLLITAVVYIAAALTGRELLKHWPSEKLFKAGLKLALFSAILLIIAAAIFHGSVIFIIAASSFFAITAGLMSPCINSEVMSIFQHIAGPASAILTLTFFAFSSLLSVVTMNLNAHSSWQVGGFFAGCFVVAAIMGWLSGR
jgi:DHA1 family bicyclomycin/chloramphenicol resistance-like MFS transporter